MPYQNILFFNSGAEIRENSCPIPDFFRDLNLDQIIDTITCGKAEYNLKPVFYTPLKDIESIKYRHEIMLDIENKTLAENIDLFAHKMRLVRRHFIQADKMDYKYQQSRWILDAASAYCDAVFSLRDALHNADLNSRGLAAFRDFLDAYLSDTEFTLLHNKAIKLQADLSEIKYCLLTDGRFVTVSKFDNEVDYSAEIIRLFESFSQGAVKDYREKLYTDSKMNYIEAGVLKFITKLFPDTFSALDRFSAEHSNFINAHIEAFDRDIQFYQAFLEYMEDFNKAGLQFCYPEVTDTHKEVCCYDGFDAALAYKLISTGSEVVRNDFYLKDNERIMVVTGPNQGGKTTFARTFGQLHYFASLGCKVPGKNARLFLPDMIFTHFERNENITDLRGKLQDDLIRLYEIHSRYTEKSIVIINEIFSSTTLQDAVLLSRKIMNAITKMDSLCVYVTFIDELASMNEKIASMVSATAPDNPSRRTYKILRKPADSLSYAVSLAEKYGLTYNQLKERIL